MVLTNLEKDEADRLAIKDHLEYLETELTRHATTPLLLQEVSDYLMETAESKTQLIGNQKNMRHHAPRTTDMTGYVAEYKILLAQATRLHASFHGIKMAFPVTATPPPAGAAAPTGATHHIKLPALELPKFSGNLQEWVSFRDLFVTAIHNSSLSKVEKLTQLKSLLTGEAARQIRSLVLSEANYDIAWKALQDRYENKRELLLSLLKRLNTQPAVTIASATSLRSLIDTTKEIIRSLEVLAQPTQHWDSIIFYILFSKMDNGSRELWEQSLPDTDIPQLSLIYDFLEQRSRALAASSAPSVKSQTLKPQQQNHVRAHHAEASKCPLGCSKPHFLISCQQFQKMTPQQRQVEVKRLNRCINCLADGHQSSTCRSKYSCKTCNRKHHTMLHFSTEVGQQQDPVRGATLSHHLYANDSIRTGLLATALVRIQAPMGGNMRRALLDNGSTNSFITEKAAKSMRLNLRPVHIPVTGLQAASCGHVKHVTSFLMSSHCNSSVTLSVTALVVNKISSSIPAEKLKKDDWYHLQGLPLADPEFHIPKDVDLLLGSEHFWSILENDKISGNDGQPIAWKSTLGWLVAGPNNTSTPVSVFNTNIDLSYQLARFFEQEDVPEEDKFTNEERDCEDHFAATHVRDFTGRFTVSLPFKNQDIQLGDSYHQAKRRFISLENKFVGRKNSVDHTTNRKLTEQWNDYQAFMKEYEKLGHMSLVPPEEIDKPANPVYYIPHHSVVKESSTTTKLRVVFDASASSTNGLSLNDCLMVGPKLQDHIADIMLRFRMHQIAFTADVAKMYRQIRVNSNDTDLQRILWRSNPNQPIMEYKLLTVTYGTASAPYQAVKCLQQLAVDEKHRFPEGSRVALDDFYVDDTASGCSTLEQAKAVVHQLQGLCMSGGFELRKWTTNSQELLDTIPVELRETNSIVEIQHQDATIKTLGVYWNPISDKYSFKLTMPPDMPGKITKRTCLSNIARIYDPLGWLAPVIIVCKIFMQELWKLQADWDDQLPFEAANKWNIIRDSLEDLNELQIPRCVVSPSAVRLILVGCSDASLKAISACIYICSISESSDPTCCLLTSKTRVASLKHVTLPRLELQGAVLLAELIQSTLKALRNTIEEVRAFTDSTITLHWVTSQPTRWKPYIRRRVQAIQEYAPKATWYHIPGNINPADCASRGISSADLLHHPLWWNGTPFFMSPNHTTAELIDEDLAVLEVEAQTKMLAFQAPPLDPLFMKFSSFQKLKRIIAYIIRFANNWVRPFRNTPLFMGSLTVDELNCSSNFILRQVQLSSFPLEISLLAAEKPLPSGNYLAKLKPFLCPSGLLRVGGRLRNAEISFDRKHQILMPKSHHVTNIIIWDIHHQNFHAGPSATLAAFQSRFWVVNGRDTIRFVLRKCVTCVRNRATLMQQVMGDLPFDRVNPSRPFSKVGVDYAGPFTIRPMVRSKVTLKCWIALFVCFATRAIHIEVVSTLSTDGFLAALRRFTSRRGMPSDVYSDCGTNFKGADKVLRDFLAITREDAVQNVLSSDGIRWHFNPAGAPHFGGLWEAGVKSIKYHLTRVMGLSRFTFEEMTTILIQIEGILNSRPLVPASSDPADLGVLTPAHFLIGEPITAVPEPSLLDLNENHLSRWQRLQKQQQLFWKRWSSEFITRLQQRPKWWTPSPDLSVGHMVIIKDERLPPLKWKLGRVIAIHPGKDGHVRVGTLKTANGELTRPIAKLRCSFVTYADWWTSCEDNAAPSQLHTPECLDPIGQVSLVSLQLCRETARYP